MPIASGALFIRPRTPQGVFANEPFTDFNDPENARQMRQALEQRVSHLGSEYSLIIGGKRLKTTEKIRSINPARPAQMVGMHQKAGAAQAETAMAAALRAFESWSRTTVEERVSLLLGAAAIIRKRKFEFMAWLTYEVGKNWAEADADVGETIDFLEFYAREALRLAALDHAHPVSRRARRAALYSARRGRGHLAVEFSLRHHGRHDVRGHRHRKHGGSQAVERCAHHRRALC